MQQTDISICIQPAGRRRRGYPFRLLTAFAATFPKGSVLTLSVKACRLCQLPLGGSLWRDRILCSSTGRCRRFEMASACALAIFSGKIIFISRLSRSAERSKRYFHGRGRNGKQHLQHCFLRKHGAAGERLLPLGGAVAQRLRGFKSAEPEKTVKRSSRRAGVNLQFFPV